MKTLLAKVAGILRLMAMPRRPLRTTVTQKWGKCPERHL